MEPSQVFETVNNQLCENNETGMFVTAFLGVLEIATGRFTYVNTRSSVPLVSVEGQPFDWLPSKRGFVLAGMEDMRYCQQEIALSPGSCLFLYTDGVTEALDPENNLYSEERLKEFFNRPEMANRSPEERLRLLHDDITAFAAGTEQADDITMLLLQYNHKRRRDEHGGTYH